MRRALAAALCAGAAAAGCAEREGAPPVVYPAALDAGGERWRAIERTLSDRLEPDSDNPCSAGAPACIDAVVAEMTRRFRALASTCDHKAPFALMYLRVTEGVEGPPFHDPAYLRHLDALFARLYFDAFDAWRAGRRDAVPGAWAIAFEAAEERTVTALGDMLLGMNAHISRDLPYALAAAGLRGADGTSAKRDFDAVNDLLADVQDPMIAEQARLFDPTVDEFTSPVVGVYASDVSAVIASWRTEAWYNARRLLEARTPRERAGAERAIEETAAARARLVETATSYPVVGGSTEERDAYCERSRRGAGPAGDR